jgi:preprotein translocase SecF subunit
MFKYSYVVYRKYAFTLSILIIAVGVASLLFQGLNLGIDFTGGTRLHINIREDFEVEEIREVLADFNLEGSQIQKVGGALDGDAREVIIKSPLLSEEERGEVIKAFQARWPAITERDILGIENVGPTIGAELRRMSFWALLVASAGMIIFITIRFEFAFAIAAILALAHDALVVLTVFSLMQIEVNGPFVAAILTIIGYSINDTIVLFDRIRENIKGRKKVDLAEIIDRSINQTLLRSINTSGTTLLVLVALFILGGVALRPFILALLIGVVTGTYSSIFIASQAWFSWKHHQESKRSAKTA